MTDITSVLIWIQAVWSSDGIPEIILLTILFLKTINRRHKKHAELSSMQRVNAIVNLVFGTIGLYSDHVCLCSIGYRPLDKSV